MSLLHTYIKTQQPRAHKAFQNQDQDQAWVYQKITMQLEPTK